ncbi:FecR family protein [Flavivirga spongiicola]|uniref:DUF4974 domain-containing protein n=1 Tax=Flavivirga spongiicola TaxID=421621 RepID=A0ABU7XUN9_9FLAO|nr:FecR domain-containing protein [Flavivirga sp. MEBiC05379]MDO5979508.1 DUF4974 domain-containing protein [Flavivirga sp. MEBiC05379]
MKKLVIKYLTDTISETELKSLIEWVQHSKKNQDQFKILLNANHKLDMANRPIDAEAAYKNLLKKIEVKRIPIIKSYQTVFKYAAVAIIFLGMAYFYQQGYVESEPKLVIPDESITLLLDNGDVKILNKGETIQVTDVKGNILGTQKGNQLVYNKELKVETLVYNTITVPYGKRYEVQLSDGTHVHLNAGTSLKYPINFIEGKKRQVFLDGEAYFDVSKDVNNSFVVNTNEIDVRVLGTQFNISSYPEDENVTTVLVEGLVSLYNSNEDYNPETATLLDPGLKAKWNKKTNHIEITKADIEMHTAWINGKIIFRYTPFKNIIKKLERHYNVEIINNNKALDDQLFAASFDIETIEQVLESFNISYAIDYSIKNNQIIIN